VIFLPLIGIPHQGELRTELVDKLLAFNQNEDVDIYFSSKTPVDCNRNHIVNHFMEETDHEYLIMVDDDIVPPGDLLDILEYDKPIMTPIIFSMRDGIPYPVVTVFKPSPDSEDRQLKAYGGDQEELMEVHGAGTGCIIIHREVFETLEQPYFEFKKGDNGELNTGEDMQFSVKAYDAGYNTYVASEYVAGHYTVMNLEFVTKLMDLAVNTKKEDMYYSNLENNEIQRQA